MTSLWLFILLSVVRLLLLPFPFAICHAVMPLTLLNSPPNLEGETIRHHQNNVQMIITPPLNGVSDLGKGDLFVAENQLYFYTRNTATGLAIPYPSIIIHAISRQNGQPCVYCQLDSEEVLAEQRRTAEDDDEDEVTELKFVLDDPNACKYYSHPKIPLLWCFTKAPDIILTRLRKLLSSILISTVDPIYIALSDCAALHPDKEFMEEQFEGEYEDDADGDGVYDHENDESDYYYTAPPSDAAELNEVGRAALAHLNSVFQMPSQREFQDMVTENGHANSVADERFKDAEEDTFK